MELSVTKLKYELDDIKSKLNDARLTGNERDTFNQLFRIVDGIIEAEHND